MGGGFGERRAGSNPARRSQFFIITNCYRKQKKKKAIDEFFLFLFFFLLNSINLRSTVIYYNCYSLKMSIAKFTW